MAALLLTCTPLAAMRTSSTLTFDRHISEFMSLFLECVAGSNSAAPLFSSRTSPLTPFPFQRSALPFVPFACCRSPTLNREWNQRMSSQHVVQDALHGEIVHQTYGLPWPLKSRELLMRCTNDVSRGTQSVTARCASVHTDRVPISSERVRMEIIGSVRAACRDSLLPVRLCPSRPSRSLSHWPCG